MKITPDAVVSLAYRMSVVERDGSLTLIEERTKDKPLEFVFGAETVLDALENHLDGKTVGWKSGLRIEAEDAFGATRPELEQWYDRKKLPAVDLKIGMKFQTQGPQGDVLAVIVKEIKGDQVLLDGNHPLAGCAVHFELEVLRVREGTPEEISTGEIKKIYH